MTDEEIINFPIDSYADDECDLFLWTTNGKLKTALKILENWNFRYSSLLVWNKGDGLNHQGLHYTLEFVLYAYRKRKGLNYYKPLETYFKAKRLRHSQKPDLFYALIRERTQSPRIDIFARKRHYGFDAYGDQVKTQIEVPLLIACVDDKRTNK